MAKAKKLKVLMTGVRRPGKQHLLSDQLAELLKSEGRRVILVEGNTEQKLLHGLSYTQEMPDGKVDFVVALDSGLPKSAQDAIIAKELDAYHLREASEPQRAQSAEDIRKLIDDLLVRKRTKADLSISGVIIPERKVAEGVLVKSTSVIWARIIEEVGKDWTKVYQIDPHVWEQIIAGAFAKSGFDQVIITPRSGDHGRDIIAVKSGLGSIRILGSVKRYNPGHLVTKEEVHALMGAVTLDPNASKGLFTTTSDFAPKILDDLNLAKAVPHRIELMNGKDLQSWLKQLSKQENFRTQIKGP